MSPAEGIKHAQLANLDLVEISPDATPPVCKILDYGKYKYELNKKQKIARKKTHKVQIKEIKLRPGTDEHDLQFKLRHAREFIEEGDKVRFRVVFKGREMAHLDLGKAMMDKVLSQIQDVAHLDDQVRLEGKNMVAMLIPGPAPKLKPAATAAKGTPAVAPNLVPNPESKLSESPVQNKEQSYAQN